MKYYCQVCGKLLRENKGVTTMNGWWVCDNATCRTLDAETNEATEIQYAGLHAWKFSETAAPQMPDILGLGGTPEDYINKELDDNLWISERLQSQGNVHLLGWIFDFRNFLNEYWFMDTSGCIASCFGRSELDVHNYSPEEVIKIVKVSRRGRIAYD